MLSHPGQGSDVREPTRKSDAKHTAGRKESAHETDEDESFDATIHGLTILLLSPIPAPLSCQRRITRLVPCARVKSVCRHVTRRALARRR
jgi:hypothetical protein